MLRRDRRFHRVVVAGWHLARRHAEPRQVLGAELAAAVITLVEEDHLVARS